MRFFRLFSPLCWCCLLLRFLSPRKRLVLRLLRLLRLFRRRRNPCHGLGVPLLLLLFGSARLLLLLLLLLEPSLRSLLGRLRLLQALQLAEPVLLSAAEARPKLVVADGRDAPQVRRDLPVLVLHGDVHGSATLRVRAAAVGSALDEGLHCLQAVPEAGEHERRDPKLVGEVDVRAAVQQHLNDHLPIPSCRLHEGAPTRVTHGVLRVSE